MCNFEYLVLGGVKVGIVAVLWNILKLGIVGYVQGLLRSFTKVIQENVTNQVSVGVI